MVTDADGRTKATLIKVAELERLNTEYADKIATCTVELSDYKKENLRFKLMLNELAVEAKKTCDDYTINNIHHANSFIYVYMHNMYTYLCIHTHTYT